jgi:uncharacterized membrane protein YhiD involved in acid resistance
VNDPFGLQGILAMPLSAGELLRNLSVALVCGLLIAGFYRWSTRRPSYSRSFINSLVALSLITAVVIMVIGNNLARAFGLVGAMSIIRFRTAVKDAQDIVFIFFSLAIGMAAGVGLVKVAILSTAFIGLSMTAISAIQLQGRRRREFLVQFAYLPGDNDPPLHIAALDKHCQRHHLVSMKSYGDEDELELSFYVLLKGEQSGGALVSALRHVEGLRNVSMFYDEDHD